MAAQVSNEAPKSANHARHLHTQAERDARMVKVVNLRSQGYSMTEIAKMIGVNVSTAHYYAAKATKGASSNGKHVRHQAVASPETPQYEGHIGYLFGKIESLIEHYADSSGVPRAVVASGVLQLFRRKARW